MGKKKYKYIYGPVPSWRLGSSLGIDPISGRKKVCSFDCVYCQLGRTGVRTAERKIFVPAEKILKELKDLPPLAVDYITFSGRGEPTLAANLGEMIDGVKKIRKEPVAVITNASLMDRKEVRRDLLRADLVVAKLDASSEGLLRKVNDPAKGMRLSGIIDGMKKFLKRYTGKFALQIMFVEANEKYARDLARLARTICADEVQLNTPLRPCAVKPLSGKKMELIEKYFEGSNTISVYKTAKKKVRPVSRRETLRRRGKV